MTAYTIISGDLGPTALAALLGTWYDEFQSKYELVEDPWGDPWSITVVTTRTNGNIRTTHGLINLERRQRRITWGTAFSLDLGWIQRQGLCPPTDLKWLRVGGATRKHFVWKRESQARRAGWIPRTAQSSESAKPSAGGQEIALSYWLPGGITRMNHYRGPTCGPSNKDDTPPEVSSAGSQEMAPPKTDKDETVVEVLKKAEARKADCPVMPTTHEQQDDAWSSDTYDQILESARLSTIDHDGKGASSAKK